LNFQKHLKLVVREKQMFSFADLCLLLDAKPAKGFAKGWLMFREGKNIFLKKIFLYEICY
jgi:hypothetical protein